MTGILIWKDAACSGKPGRGLRRNVLLCILRLDAFGWQSSENLADILHTEGLLVSNCQADPNPRTSW